MTVADKFIVISFAQVLREHAHSFSHKSYYFTDWMPLFILFILSSSVCGTGLKFMTQQIKQRKSKTKNVIKLADPVQKVSNLALETPHLFQPLWIWKEFTLPFVFLFHCHYHVALFQQHIPVSQQMSTIHCVSKNTT